MKKIIDLLFLGCCVVVLLSACSNNKSESEISSEVQASSTQAEAEVTTEEAAEGYDILGGRLWKVGGLYYRNKIIDINDNDALADLYDSTFLSFDSDGSFMYINLFPKEGTYKPYAGDGTYDYYLLKTERTLKYDSEKDEFVESESASNKTFIIAVLDENTIEFVEFDAITGRAKANEDPLIFVKSDEDSAYVQNNKTEIAQNNTNNTNEVPSAGDNSGEQYIKADSSYQSILDEYTEKMENAVGGLVREYKSEATGISDIERLAEINNDKIEKLAEICNEGIGKMAEQMYAKGDSYDTYELWAGKLMDNYNDIAQEIMDAYLDSAIN